MPIVGHNGIGPAPRRWPGLLASGIAGVMLFFLGRLSAREAGPEKSLSDDQTPELPSQPRPRAQRGFLAHGVPRPAALGTPDSCTQTTDQDRKDTATFVVDNLFRRVEPYIHDPIFPTAEARANQLRPFINGLAEGIRQTRPDLFKALGEDFDDRLCNGGMSDDKTLLLSYLAADLPEMADSKGFDCFFTRAKGKEDVPLWYMLDAWQASGLEKTAALAQVQATASDERTIRRLKPIEEQRAARMVEENQRVAATRAQGAPFSNRPPSGQELPPPTPVQN